MSEEKDMVPYLIELPRDMREEMIEKAREEGRTARYVIMQFIRAYLAGDKRAREIIEKK